MTCVKEVTLTYRDIRSAIVEHAKKVAGGMALEPSVKFVHPKYPEPLFILEDLKVILRG